MSGRYSAIATFVAVVSLGGALRLNGQNSAAPQAATPAAPARAQALFDLTGYWVSFVTEDWRYRMLTPSKGDYAGVPMTPEGRRIADAWDPAADEAAGSQCKSYGAAALMRVPTRLHVTWQDERIGSISRSSEACQSS